MRRPALFVALSALLVPAVARAQAADPPAETKPAVTSPPEDMPPVESKTPVDANAGARKQDLTPAPVDAPPTGKTKFTADPVGDGAIIAIGAMFGLLTNEILSTEEIRPQQISPTFDKNKLLGIDRGAINQKVDASAGTISNVGLFAALGYAVLDTTLDIFREGKSAALVDGIMYAEAFLVTESITNVTKIAFRRPRPRAYMARQEFIDNGGNPESYDNAEIDSSLSFVSGHASQTAAMSAAATYIAFSRSPGTARPWLTLAGGTALTTMVSWGRVKSGAHFPTDVLAGSIIGAGVGALIVHLHREDSVKQRPVWIGAAPLFEGGMITASGLF